ncbi:hypothetical protein VTN02DRAFT_740 [Thermoascus thermophilus]
MEDSRSPAEQVIAALRERNISFKQSDIESALNDESLGFANAQWASEHLGYDTLLSREELTLYSKLESSGTLQALLQNPDLSATRPFLDENIRNAIDSLKASTAAIQKQTEILALQYEDLRKQLRNDKERVLVRSRALAQLKRRHELERQHVNAAADDLAHDLETRLKAGTESAAADRKKALSSIATRLKDDDRKLKILEKLASGIGSSEEDRVVGSRAAELTAKLAGYVAEEIHCRLDRLYMETICAGRGGSVKGSEHEHEPLDALEEELESLYPEIGVLAEMSAKQQFSDPILSELRSRHNTLRLISEKRLDYVLEYVTGMTLSIEGIIERLRDCQSYHDTMEVLATAYKSEFDNGPTTQSSRRGTLQRDSFQTSWATPRSEKRKSTSPLAESQALEGFLRRLGISLDSVCKPPEEGGGRDSLYEKKLRMLERLHNLEIAADTPLIAQLSSADQAAQLLDSSLHADSSFRISLSDVSQEQKLAALEEELGSIQKGIEGINLDVLYQKDKTQEKFIEKWL